MPTVTQEPPRAAAEQRRAPSAVVPREMWAALAISVIWLAVLFTAMFGPDIVSTTVGATSTTVPSAVVVALCAFPATWVVARYGFGGGRDRGDG